MATVAGNFEGRIQLKHDTETNWKLVPDFKPLLGEIIIYEPEPEKGYPYSRIKIGDGRTISQLPFIDSGTLNGQSEFISKYETYGAFPQPGSSDKLYMDLSNGQIYYYTAARGYSLLNNLAQKTTIRDVVSWSGGQAATASIENNILILQNGIAPQLLTKHTSVFTDITTGGNN